MLLNCASTVWDCPGCGARLEFDPQRRVAVAGYGTLFGLPPMIFSGIFHWWWGAAIGLAIYALFMSYDSVRLKRPGVRDNRS